MAEAAKRDARRDAATRRRLEEAEAAAAREARQAGAAIDDGRPGDVTVQRAGIRQLTARDVDVTQGGIGLARAEHVAVELGGIGAALAGEVTVRQGIARTILARDVRVGQSLVRSIVANTVHAERPTGVLVLLARRVDGDVRAVLDWRGAAVLGAFLALVAWLARRR